MGQWFSLNLCVEDISLFAKISSCEKFASDRYFFFTLGFFFLISPNKQWRENETQFLNLNAFKYYRGFSDKILPVVRLNRDKWHRGCPLVQLNRITILIFHIIYHAIAFTLAFSQLQLLTIARIWLVLQFSCFLCIPKISIEKWKFVVSMINMCIAFSF